VFSQQVRDEVVASLQCPPEWVKVEDVQAGSVVVDVSLWVPTENEQHIQSTDLVKELLNQAKEPTSEFYQHAHLAHCLRIESVEVGLELSHSHHHHHHAVMPDDFDGARDLGDIDNQSYSSESSAPDPAQTFQKYKEWRKENKINKIIKQRIDKKADVPVDEDGFELNVGPNGQIHVGGGDTVGSRALEPVEVQWGVGGLKDAMETIASDNPFQGLRPFDAEDSIFANPGLAFEEFQTEIHRRINPNAEHPQGSNPPSKKNTEEAPVSRMSEKLVGV